MKDFSVRHWDVHVPGVSGGQSLVRAKQQISIKVVITLVPSSDLQQCALKTREECLRAKDSMISLIT